MSLVQSAPRFSAAAAAAIAHDLFQVSGAVTALPSERDQNFLVQNAVNAPPEFAGVQFVLKIANALESRAMLDAQNALLECLAMHPEIQFASKLVPGRSGKLIESVAGQDGQYHFVRMLTYLPGKPLATVKPHSPALLRSLGRVMGELDATLANFDHPALHRDFHWDVANASAVIRRHLHEINDDSRRELVARYLEQFEREAAPHLAALRRGVIHGDANDYNVLAGGDGDLWAHNQQVVGIIDFGDAVYSTVACEPAIAAAYAMLDKDDPLGAACQVVAGYHASHNLADDELAVIWHLLLMRLCMSVCHSAHQRRLEPDNAYLSISERPAWELLFKLEQIHPRLAHYTLRAACGLPAVPHSQHVREWLVQQAEHAASLLAVDLRTAPTVVFDLSIGSLMLGSTSRSSGVSDDSALFSDLLARRMVEAGVEVGIGRYDEARSIYTGPAFALSPSPTGERRTVHLALDLWAPAGTPVYAPLAGVVHALANNTTRHDYGPVILLEHQTGAGVPFYTLYGHLSLESLAAIHVGQAIQAGAALGSIGAPPVNGDWPPHVHFQVITDLLDVGCDFPGVAAASQRRIWLDLSPDPNLLLAIPTDRFPTELPSRQETLAERQRRIGRNLSISYRQPLKIVRGRGQYLFDDTGRAYLDGVNNVAHVGHCHPHVVAAGQRQMAVLNTNTRYLHDNINDYARRLCATLPEPLSVCFFVNSGSEANDLALRLARTYTGQVDMICVDAGYHGHTQALIEISPYKHNGPGGRGAPNWVQMAQMPDPYRGPHRGYGSDSGVAYAADVQRSIEQIQARGRGVAGFICESMIGCGGQIVLPDNYMAAAFAHVRAAGGLCIADEVQVGFGRPGSHFWGFETQQVIPDIVTMGKPAGNGHPLAVVVTTPAIAAAFANGMEYFNTFGGNPVSCAIGLAVLDVIEQEQLQANALATGNYLMARLRDLMPRHAIIGDVRGLGLYIGVDLVLDRTTQEPAGDHASYISNRMADHGILISTDGPFHQVLKIKPPLVFDHADADHLVETLARVLDEDVLQVG